MTLISSGVARGESRGECGGCIPPPAIFINALDQRWAKYGPRAGCGPRDDFMRPAGSYKKMNRSTEDAKTFSFAPHLYFRRTQDIQWKTGYARI